MAVFGDFHLEKWGLLGLVYDMVLFTLEFVKDCDVYILAFSPGFYDYL
jgi:hypothetical protein